MKHKIGEKIKMKIRRGDNVIVLTGREKGKSGEVLRVDREKNRVLVQGVNMLRLRRRRYCIIRSLTLTKLWLSL